MMESANIRYQQAKRVTLLGAVINVVLAVVKIVTGYFGHSQAVIADGFHSLSDLLSDFVVLIAARYGSASADRAHPYGHQRFETMATMVLAVLLMLVALGIGYDAIRHLNTTQSPDQYVLWIVLVSIGVKEFLYQYTKRVAHRVKSKLLYANAWHHRSDAASSLIVLIGVGGALLGWTYFDAIAAIIVAVMIVKMAWNLGLTSVRELVDTAVDDELLDQINQVILATDGVVALHQLRTRLMGEDILVDVHVLVDPWVSVSEGHHIAQQVHLNLLENIERVIDVTVHIDPEQDEIAEKTKQLPTRVQLLPELEQHWQSLPSYHQVQRIGLHYIEGQVQVDVYLSVELLAQHSTQELEQQYRQAIAHLTTVRYVVLYFT
ncbi:MAG: cation diffusion facilitator family transporter [Legionellales bacterium]|nr:cation diffusion facilitator family transporter [Legionellales bacterium]